MIIHKPTGKTFLDSKEAKKFFGTSYYYKIEKEKKDLIFKDNNQLATNDEQTKSVQSCIR